MRSNRFTVLPACLALLLGTATTAALACCGGDIVHLPAPIARGVVCGDHCYAVTTEGRLLDVDLKKHAVKELTDVGAKLCPLIDAHCNTVCVVRGQKVLLLDTQCGKVARELDCGEPIHAVGFACADRLLVHTAKTLDTIDLKSGKVVACIPLPVSAYVTCQVSIAGGKVYVATLEGYGIALTRLSTLDPRTGEKQTVKLPDGARGVSGLVGAPDGSVFLTTIAKTDRPQTFRYDASGKLVGALQTMPGHTLVGIWAGQPVTLFAGGRRLLIDDMLQVVQSK
jgi:hypothetical protein